MIPNQPPARVVIIEDHALVLAGLKRIIDSAPGLRVVGEALDGDSALACLQETPCDLLMMDWSIPGTSGTELLHEVRARWPKLPILVVTMRNESQVAQVALEAGASGYITKESEPDRLLEAVRQVIAGDHFLPPNLMKALAFSSVHPTKKVLSPRETQILKAIVRGQSNREIAAALFVSEKTVSSHKSNMMGKLELKSNADLIRYGMKLMADEGSA